MATAFALIAAAAPIADAGQYQFTACGDAAAVSDGTAGWTPFSNAVSSPGVESTNMCDWGGLHAEIHPTGGASVGIDTGLGWTFTAPANTYISGARFKLGGWLRASDGRNRGYLTVGTPLADPLDAFDSSSNAVLWDMTGDDPLGHLLTIDHQGLRESSLSVGIWCKPPADNPTSVIPCTGPTPTAWMSIFEPKVTLGDDDVPVGEDAAGSMVSDPQYQGTETLSYSASDLGSGLARFRLYVDGQKVQDQGLAAGRCVPVATAGDGTPVYSAVKPCPGSAQGSASLDTTTLIDGDHTILATVVDAARQESPVFSAGRTVVNHAPAGTAVPTWADAALAEKVRVGDTLTAVPGAWTGVAVTDGYAWQRCDVDGANCAVIATQIGKNYVVKAEDVGHRLRFVQTATNLAGSKTATTTSSGIVVKPAPTPSGGSGADGANGSNGSNGSDGSNGSNGSNAVGGDGGSSAGGSGGPVFNGGIGGASTLRSTFLGRVVGQAPGVPCSSGKARLSLLRIGDRRIKLGHDRLGKVAVLVTCAGSGEPIAEAPLDVTTKVGARSTTSQSVTGDDGVATLFLDQGPSRTITVGYRMFSDDPAARATASVKVSVPAQISIKATKKVVRGGDPVTLTGRLAGGHVPKRGVTLAVQRWDRGRWRSFARTRATGKGAFSWTYRFAPAGHPSRARLRVVIDKGQVDYPYTSVASKAVEVTLQP